MGTDEPQGERPREAEELREPRRRRKPRAARSMSVDDLTAALAQMGAPQTREGPQERPSLAGEDAADPRQAQPAIDERAAAAPAGDVTPRSIVEAAIFTGDPTGRPLSGERLAALMRGVDEYEVDALVRELNDVYAAQRRPYAIRSRQGGYEIALREEFSGVVDRFRGRLRQVRLSQAAIEVLAAVAYNQPVTSKEVTQLRGHASGAILSQMVRRRLLRIERPEESPRTGRYYTTDRFLELFGLRTLEDLPRSEELNER